MRQVRIHLARVVGIGGGDELALAHAQQVVLAHQPVDALRVHLPAALPKFLACWPILRSNSAIRPSDQRCFPLPGNTLPGPWRNSRRQRCSTLVFTSNARATSLMETPCSSRCTAASLNSLVNILLHNPMT